MKIYLGIKFHEDNSNREVIEGISNRLTGMGHEVFCVTRDIEKWGETSFSSEDLMKKTFEIIDQSDLALIEFSEKGVGLGIEAGYAYSKNIPVQVIARSGSDISNTMKGIAKSVNFYDSFQDINIG